MNRVTLLGRLGKDPKSAQPDQARKVANFSVATSEQWKDKATGEKKERTRWHSIVVWGALAGTVERYLQKGKPRLSGRAQRTRKWQDQNGADRWSTEGCPVRLQLHLADHRLAGRFGRWRERRARMTPMAICPIAARSDGRRDSVLRRNGRRALSIAERLEWPKRAARAGNHSQARDRH